MVGTELLPPPAIDAVEILVGQPADFARAPQDVLVLETQDRVVAGDLRAQGIDAGLDTEQLRDEALQVRREFDQQRGVIARTESVTIAQDVEATSQSRVGRGQAFAERRIKPRQGVGGLQFVKAGAVECSHERTHSQDRFAAGWPKRKIIADRAPGVDGSRFNGCLQVPVSKGERGLSPEPVDNNVDRAGEHAATRPPAATPEALVIFCSSIFLYIKQSVKLLAMLSLPVRPEPDKMADALCIT